MMLVIYIAGPYRGPTPWDIEQNIRRAESVALRVAELGVTPLCPHTMYRFFDKTCTDEFWIKATTELLRRCEAIVMCEGWQQSEGSIAEHRYAMKNGLLVFDLESNEWPSQLSEWVAWATYYLDDR